MAYLQTIGYTLSCNPRFHKREISFVLPCNMMLPDVNHKRTPEHSPYNSGWCSGVVFRGLHNGRTLRTMTTSQKNSLNRSVGFRNYHSIFAVQNTVIQILLDSPLYRICYFFLFFHSLLMSSKVLPFVSGTSFHTKIAATTQMIPYSP